MNTYINTNNTQCLQSLSILISIPIYNATVNTNDVNIHTHILLLFTHTLLFFTHITRSDLGRQYATVSPRDRQDQGARMFVSVFSVSFVRLCMRT